LAAPGIVPLIGGPLSVAGGVAGAPIVLVWILVVSIGTLGLLLSGIIAANLGFVIGPVLVLVEGVVLGSIALWNLRKRVAAEGAAARADRENQVFLKTIPDLFYVLDREGKLIRWNRQFELVSRYDSAEMLGKSAEDFLVTQERETLSTAIRLAFQNGYAEFEGQLVAKDGRTVPYQWTGVPLRDDKGNPIGLTGIGRDISPRRAIEQHGREQTDVAETINRVGRLLSAELDPQKLVQAVTDAATELSGAEFGAFLMTEQAQSGGVFRPYTFSGSDGLREAFSRLSMPRDTAMFAATFQGAGVVRVDDVTGDARFGHNAPDNGVPPGHPTVRSYLTMPVISRSGEVFGGLFLGHSLAGVFTNRGEQIVSGLVAQAAVALDNARLYQAAQREIEDRKVAEEQNQALNLLLQRRLERSAALRLIYNAITANIDRRQMLGIILEQVLSQLGVDAADVLLRARHSPVLEFECGRGFRLGDAARCRFRMGEGRAGRAAVEGNQVAAAGLSTNDEPPSRVGLILVEGFRSYAAVPLVVKGEVKGVLEVFGRGTLDANPDWIGYLETFASQAAIAVENASLFEGLQRTNLELTVAYDATIEGWAAALDLRDKETEGHSRRVTEMTIQLMRALGGSEQELVHVRRGALLHDIGKLGIPDAILLKPAPLSEAEWSIMRLHPGYAFEWLSPIAFLRQALEIPHCHHEKWDGSGYPRGLRGDQIPLAARAFAAVDIWDALSNDRPYHKAWPPERVQSHLASIAGTHLDPHVVEVFLRLLDENAKTSRDLAVTRAEPAFQNLLPRAG
jgi:PAS domain S-box-containing protein